MDPGCRSTGPGCRSTGRGCCSRGRPRCTAGSCTFRCCRCTPVRRAGNTAPRTGGRSRFRNTIPRGSPRQSRTTRRAPRSGTARRSPRRAPPGHRPPPLRQPPRRPHHLPPAVAHRQAAARTHPRPAPRRRTADAHPGRRGPVRPGPPTVTGRRGGSRPCSHSRIQARLPAAEGARGQVPGELRSGTRLALLPDSPAWCAFARAHTLTPEVCPRNLRKPKLSVEITGRHRWAIRRRDGPREPSPRREP